MTYTLESDTPEVYLFIKHFIWTWQFNHKIQKLHCVQRYAWREKCELTQIKIFVEKNSLNPVYKEKNGRFGLYLVVTDASLFPVYCFHNCCIKKNAAQSSSVERCAKLYQIFSRGVVHAQFQIRMAFLAGPAHSPSTVTLITGVTFPTRNMYSRLRRRWYVVVRSAATWKS